MVDYNYFFWDLTSSYHVSKESDFVHTYIKEINFLKMSQNKSYLKTKKLFWAGEWFRL